MIIANIKDAKRYFSINPNFEKAFDFLKTLSKDSEKGTKEFDGFRCNVCVLNTPESEGKLLEAHRDYLDIHYVIEGSEAIGYADIDKLEIDTEYNSKDDYLLLKGEMHNVYLNEGDFCIVFPEDAHAPAMRAFDDKVKKAIVKIRI